MSDDASARVSGVSIGAPMVPGRWHLPSNHAGLGTGLLSTNSRVLAIPMPFSRACTLSALGVDITVASEAGGLLRLGVAADAGGIPGPVLLDAGTLDATVLGFNSLAIALPIQPDWYWLLVGAQNCPTTRPTCRVFQQGGNNRVANTTGGGSNANAAYTMDGVSGAFPPAYVVGNVTVVSVVPAVWVKA